MGATDLVETERVNCDQRVRGGVGLRDLWWIWAVPRVRADPGIDGEEVPGAILRFWLEAKMLRAGVVLDNGDKLRS